MSYFSQALAFTLTWEGGLVDHPSDPGGLTKYGISKKAYPDVDIRALTIDQAAAIYRRDYWDKMKCDQLPDGVAFCLFDFAVNSGEDRASKALQQIARVKADGDIGDITLAALRPLSERYIVEQLIQFRTDFYIDLCFKSKLYLPFIKGWARRLTAVAVRAGELLNG